MTFETYFKASSYATVACGVAALALAGGVGPGLAALFALLMAVAWALEGRRQLSERAGLVVVLVALPLFYLDWRFQAGVAAVGEYASLGALVHLTLFLSAVKLLQVKADRDWLFLYLIAFFEVLLAAGLSISPLFVLTLGLYLFSALLTVVCFELRKARRAVPESESRLLVAHDSAAFKGERGGEVRARELRRLPVAALCLLGLVLALALPIFYITPRFGASALSLAGGTASSGYVGFSDRMRLGDIGRLQANRQLVMRVRVEGQQAARNPNLRWRGVALDNFDGRTWRRSSTQTVKLFGNDRQLFQLGTTEDLSRLTTQTFFVEPLDTPVVFAAPRAVALQGAFPFVTTDSEQGLTSSPHPRERISYRAFSDTVEPAPERLRADDGPYPSERAQNLQPPVSKYLQLPDALDPRVKQLARSVAERAGARNRYDVARAVEAHLSRNAYGGDYGYSLERLPTGGDPLADFLFRVRAGHCEYFSSAMALMLRTQDVAARVVNGFQAGEFNDAAGAYVVRQYDAHSWVEVYFPETGSWVTFDPTPPSRPGGAQDATVSGRLRKYADALELFWIQYFVAYDRQEQRSLAQSLRTNFSSFGSSLSEAAGRARARLAALWAASPDDAGAGAPRSFTRRSLAAALPLAAGLLLLLALALRWLKRRAARLKATAPGTAVAFYGRMMKALERRGLRRAADQTPLEFAQAVGVPDALRVTEAYHRVRYGAQKLSPSEAAEVEDCLRRMEEEDGKW